MNPIASTAARLRAEARSPAYFRRVLFWFFVLGWLPALALLLGAIILAWFLFTLPPLEDIERISPSLITRVYARDSSLLREYYSEHRKWRPLDRIPQTQVQAVLAIEDQDFFHHSGVDLKAIPAALRPALSGRRVRGASTLTQQLTKRVFLSPERSLARKLREILLAVEIERTYTKREILEFYLNQVYMGAGAYGFETASERYFSRPLDSLTVAQQALLAGLLQRPESLRPDRHPEAALERRNLVLKSMIAFKAIDARTAAFSEKEPLGLRMRDAEDEMRDEARARGTAYFVETVRERVEAKWGRGYLDSAGLNLYTTLDRRIQAVADSCLADQVAEIQGRMNRRTAEELGMARRLRRPEDEILAHWDFWWSRFDSLFLRNDSVTAARKFPSPLRYHKAQGAVVVIENGTGAVRALSGGLDWKESNYNRATQAVRSPGSAFKAIVYAAAVDQGASPGGRVEDKPLSLPDPDDSTKTWSPHNLEYDYEGPMTLRRAFYRSRNIPAIEVARQTGLDTVVAYARRFGLERPLRAVPALAIGGCDATPFEMTAAFSVFPNRGQWVEPRFLETLADRNGAPMSLGAPNRRRVIGEPAAWILCGMLQDVNIHGTAADVWADGFQIPSGGKTGTSNDFCDAWYVGFTRRYTVGVWIGNDDHAPLGPGHTGTDDALPIWLGIMHRIYQELPRSAAGEGFARPPGVEDVRLCKLTGRLAQPFCDSVVRDFRVAGAAQAGAEPGSGFALQACRPELHAMGKQGFFQANGRSGRGSSLIRKLWKKITPW